MIKQINHDPVFLMRKSYEASSDDLYIAQDLRDTLKENRDRCVGMAANMIGINKNIIVFDDDGKYTVMFNPVIIKKDKAYDTEEGCLSLSGIRKTKRYRIIKVQYQDEKFRMRFQTYEGWTAQIIQHEIDHCNGILI